MFWAFFFSYLFLSATNLRSSRISEESVPLQFPQKCWVDGIWGLGFEVGKFEEGNKAVWGFFLRHEHNFHWLWNERDDMQGAEAGHHCPKNLMRDHHRCVHKTRLCSSDGINLKSEWGWCLGWQTGASEIRLLLPKRTMLLLSCDSISMQILVLTAQPLCPALATSRTQTLGTKPSPSSLCLTVLGEDQQSAGWLHVRVQKERQSSDCVSVS